MERTQNIVFSEVTESSEEYKKIAAEFQAKHPDNDTPTKYYVMQITSTRRDDDCSCGCGCSSTSGGTGPGEDAGVSCDLYDPNPGS